MNVWRRILTGILTLSLLAGISAAVSGKEAAGIVGPENGKERGAEAAEEPVKDTEAETVQDKRLWAYQAVHAGAGESLGYDGTGVRIAVLDTGIRSTHEVFEGAVIEPGKDYTGSESGGTNDYVGHGTMVASLIAAQPGNGLGMKGIAPGASLIPLKCFDGEKAVVSVLSQAIYDAVNVYHCDIIHMSWGVREEDEELKAAVRYAADRGIILIAAAGNEGGEEVFYPSGWTEAIGVGAAGRELKTADYSAKSPAVLVNAPGTGIFGAGHTSDRAETFRTGTSYAAAYVTGAAALAVQAVPGITGQELADVLLESARETEGNTEGLSPDTMFLDIGALLRRLL
ncbi:MAG: S8 family serine peptidase [Eubacteriales bacterium]|nr:S8 family serine peptidase [Eubacteriales bacterium]